jgi:hypothetical protein
MYVSDLSVHYNESQIFVSLVYIFNFNLSVNTVSSTATPKSSIGKRHRSRFAPSLERFFFFGRVNWVYWNLEPTDFSFIDTSKRSRRPMIKFLLSTRVPIKAKILE